LPPDGFARVSPGTDSLKNDILRHVQFTLGNDAYKPDKFSCFMGLAYAVRDRLIERWTQTQRSLYDTWPSGSTFYPWSFCQADFSKIISPASI
jgi:starch phosphorylase